MLGATGDVELLDPAPVERSASDPDLLRQAAEALQKAERYRLLREAEAAESICLDVLAVDPTNQAATVTLLLACTASQARSLRDQSGTSWACSAERCFGLNPTARSSGNGRLLSSPRRRWAHDRFGDVPIQRLVQRAARV